MVQPKGSQELLIPELVNILVASKCSRSICEQREAREMCQCGGLIGFQPRHDQGGSMRRDEFN